MSTRIVSNPGTASDAKVEDEDGGQEMLGGAVSRFRPLAARCNYASIDRPDIQWAVNACSRDMSMSTRASIRRLARVAAYLDVQLLLVLTCWRQFGSHIYCSYCDASLAHGKRTPKSSSGACCVAGTRCIKRRSMSQSVMVHSSAEAQLYGVTRGSCGALCLQSLAECLVQNMDARSHVDFTAAMPIAERRGLGSVRHTDGNVLWTREQQVRDRLPLVNARCTRNSAGLMAKSLAEPQVNTYLELVHIEFRGGRAGLAADLRRL